MLFSSSKLNIPTPLLFTDIFAWKHILDIISISRLNVIDVEELLAKLSRRRIITSATKCTNTNGNIHFNIKISSVVLIHRESYSIWVYFYPQNLKSDLQGRLFWKIVQGNYCHLFLIQQRVNSRNNIQ